MLLASSPNRTAIIAPISLMQGHSWTSSARLLEELYHRGVQPDEFTRGALVNICGLSDEWQLSLHFLYGHLLCASDAVSVNAAVSACEGQNTWHLSIKMLAALPQQRLETSILAVNSAISALSWSQQWKDALELLNLADYFKLKPTEVTWNALAAVARKSVQWQLCCWLLTKMLEQQMPPDILALEATFGACELSNCGEQQAAALLEAGNIQWRSV